MGKALRSLRDPILPAKKNGQPDSSSDLGPLKHHPSPSSQPAISFAWMYATPEMSRKFLDKNFERNRPKRNGWVAALAESMVAGEFYPTHQGIAFDEEGFLIDGQHRLEAIVASGKSQWLLVAYGVPRAAVVALDIHARRSMADQIRVIDPDISPGNQDIAIARMMIQGPTSHSSWPRQTMLISKVHQFLCRHWDAIRFAQHHRSRRRTSASAVRAVVGRAYLHGSHERLEEFLRVLDTGEANGEQDFAAVKLRELLDREPYLTRGGHEARTECYRRTSSALRFFLERRPLSKIFADSNDSFPLPDGVED